MAAELSKVQLRRRRKSVKPSLGAHQVDESTKLRALARHHGDEAAIHVLQHPYPGPEQDRETGSRKLALKKDAYFKPA
jgi:hypothetical protein